MFNLLTLILITFNCWHYASARHLMPPNYHRSLQQPYYLPYSDYGYTYSGPPPYQPPYNQPFQQPYHSPLYSPPGTYYDQRRGILRPFPGGGVPVLVDYHKRCSNNYVGLKPHPDQNQYYYVCKPDCVIFGKCQNLQIFNNTTGQCIQHPPPEYLPTCSTPGRFPLFSDCHLYYKCEEDLQPKIYSCPAYMVFSPASKKCISGNKCTPTQISANSAYMPEYCANKFPPCYENGTFRSPSDCSLYYKCELQKNSVYLQTRMRCPSGQFYDLQKEECLPSSEVPCDCIQVAELVYPKPNSLPYQPAVYPAQFDFDSLEENLYPVEFSLEEQTNNCVDNETKSLNELENEEILTTLLPLTSETISNTEELGEKDDSEVVVLSDYVDLGDPKEESEEIPDAIATTISSEETTSVEGSGTTESESAETLKANITEESASITEEEEPSQENITKENELETATPLKDSSEELTDETEILAEELEIKPEEPLEEETTTTSTTVFPKTELPSSSSTAEPCENIILKDEEGNDKPLPTDISDIHSQNETQSHTCLPKLTTANLESDQTTNTIDSDFTRDSRSTLHEQNLTTINTQTPTITTQLPTTKVQAETENLELEKSLEDFSLAKEKDNLEEDEDLESNLLDSETNLETAETTRSSEKTTPTLQETTQNPLEDERNLKEGEEEDTKQLLESTEEIAPEDSSLGESDILEENTLTTFTTKESENETGKELEETSPKLQKDIEEDEVPNILEETSLNTSTTKESNNETIKEDSSSGESEVLEENTLTTSTTKESENETEKELEQTNPKLQKNIKEDDVSKALEENSLTTSTTKESENKTEQEFEPTNPQLQTDIAEDEVPHVLGVSSLNSSTTEESEIETEKELELTSPKLQTDFEENELKITTTSQQSEEVTENDFNLEHKVTRKETFSKEHEVPQENTLRPEISTISEQTTVVIETKLNSEQKATEELTSLDEHDVPKDSSLSTLKPEIATISEQTTKVTETKLDSEQRSTEDLTFLEENDVPKDNSLSTLKPEITISEQTTDATETKLDSEQRSTEDLEFLEEDDNSLNSLKPAKTTISEETTDVIESKLDSEQRSTEDLTLLKEDDVSKDNSLKSDITTTSKQPREITENDLGSKQEDLNEEISLEEDEVPEENSLDLKSEKATTSKNFKEETENKLNTEQEHLGEEFSSEEDANAEGNFNSLDNLEKEIIATTTEPKDEIENKLEMKTTGDKLSSIEDMPSTKTLKDLEPKKHTFDTTTFTLILEETTLSNLEDTTTTELPPTPSTTLNPPADETTENPWNLIDQESDLFDTEIALNNFEATTQIPEENLDTNTLQDKDSSSSNSSETKSEKFVTLRAADFQEEELLPVHSKTSNDFDYITDNSLEDTTDVIYNDDDYTTIKTDQETTTLATNEEQKHTLETLHDNVLRRRQTLNDESTQASTSSTEKPTTTSPITKEETNSHELDSYEDELGVLDSEIVLHSNEVNNNVITSVDESTQASTSSTEKPTTQSPLSNEQTNSHELDSYEDELGVLDSEIVLHSDEVSNNVITSVVETTKQTTIETSTTERQQFPHTQSTTISTTQTPTTTPNYTTIINTTPLSIKETTDSITGPCKKSLLDSVVLHVRDEAPSQLNFSSSLPSKSLYYILKSKPVINSNNTNVNNSKNEIVAAPPCGGEDSAEIPRLEIIAERPIDVHFSICPSTCDKDHEHKFAPSSSRAVFLRWFAKKSKQTLALETVNEVESVEKKDC